MPFGITYGGLCFPGQRIEKKYTEYGVYCRPIKMKLEQHARPGYPPWIVRSIQELPRSYTARISK